MSTSDNYTRFSVGETVNFETVKYGARGSISITARQGVIESIQGRVLVVKSRGRQYGVWHEDARKMGEKTNMTEIVDRLSGADVKP